VEDFPAFAAGHDLAGRVFFGSDPRLARQPLTTEERRQLVRFLDALNDAR
jgi:hypothetical protein